MSLRDEKKVETWCHECINKLIRDNYFIGTYDDRSLHSKVLRAGTSQDTSPITIYIALMKLLQSQR